MNCCDEFGNCNQGRDCPVRKGQAQAQAPANRIATLRPMYRRCDSLGVCQSPDEACQGGCMLDTAVYADQTREDYLVMRVLLVLIGLLTLTIIAGVVGFAYGGDASLAERWAKLMESAWYVASRWF